MSDGKVYEDYFNEQDQTLNDKIYLRPEKNPEYEFAFKMVISDQIAEAKVVDVNYLYSYPPIIHPYNLYHQ